MFEIWLGCSKNSDPASESSRSITLYSLTLAILLPIILLFLRAWLWDEYFKLHWLCIDYLLWVDWDIWLPYEFACSAVLTSTISSSYCTLIYFFRNSSYNSPLSSSLILIWSNNWPYISVSLLFIYLVSLNSASSYSILSNSWFFWSFLLLA